MEPRSSNDYSKAFSFQFPNNLTLEVAVLTDSGLILFNISDGEKQQLWKSAMDYLFKVGPTLLKCGQVDQSAVICYDNDVP